MSLLQLEKEAERSTRPPGAGAIQKVAAGWRKSAPSADGGFRNEARISELRLALLARTYSLNVCMVGIRIRVLFQDVAFVRLTNVRSVFGAFIESLHRSAEKIVGPVWIGSGRGASAFGTPSHFYIVINIVRCC